MRKERIVVGEVAPIAFTERFLDGLWDQVVRHFVQDLFSEPLLNYFGRNLTRPEAGYFGTAPEIACDTVDLSVDDLTRDFYGNFFLRITDVGELGLHVFTLRC